MFPRILFIALTIFAFSSNVSAQLVHFTFGSNSLSPTTKHTLVTSSNVQVTSQNITFGTLVSAGFQSVPYIQSTDGWRATMREDAKYFSVSLSLPEGFVYNITGFSFEAGVSQNGPEVIGVSINDANFEELSISASGVLFVEESGIESLAGQSTIDFRIAGWIDGSRNSSGGGALRIDNIRIYGTISSENQSPALPLVYITTVGEINTTSINLEVDIPFDGNLPITQKGIFYAEAGFDGDFEPGQFGVTVITSDEITEKFDALTEGLQENFRYRIAAFARNDFGTRLSESVYFNTRKGFDGSGYRETFSEFTSAGALSAEWGLSNSSYAGNFGSGSALGLRGGSDVLGFQNTGASGVFTAKLTLQNTTASPISTLAISYDGRVARTDQGRSPEWNVSLNGVQSADLTYSTIQGVDRPGIQKVFKDLHIPVGGLIEIIWSTSQGEGSGSNKQIGISNVVVSLPTESVFTLRGDAGWRMFSAPLWHMKTERLLGWSPVQGYGEDGHDRNFFTGYNGSQWTPASENNSISVPETVHPGNGFLLYVFDNDQAGSSNIGSGLELVQTGIDPFFDITVPVHHNGNRWNLLGNPFSTAFDLAQLTGDGDFVPTVQIWQDAPNNADTEAGSGTWVLSSSSEVGGIIAAGQGFMLQNAETDPASRITFPVSGKTSGGELLKRKSPPMIEFILASESENDLHIHDKAAVLHFQRDDADYLQNMNITKLASLSDSYALIYFEGEDIALAQKSVAIGIGETLSIPLNFYANRGQSDYILSWQISGTLPDSWRFNLIDLLEQTSTPMRTHEAYTFSVTSQTNKQSDSKELVLASVGQMRFLIQVEANEPLSAEPPNVPYQTALMQNYPNPFNPTTTLAFELKEATYVELQIFDMLGRSVGSIEKQFYSAGRHQVTIDASTWSSGVYIYRMKTSEGVRFDRNMTLIK